MSLLVEVLSSASLREFI